MKKREDSANTMPTDLMADDADNMTASRKERMKNPFGK